MGDIELLTVNTKCRVLHVEIELIKLSVVFFVPFSNAGSSASDADERERGDSEAEPRSHERADHVRDTSTSGASFKPEIIHVAYRHSDLDVRKSNKETTTNNKEEEPEDARQSQNKHRGLAMEEDETGPGSKGDGSSFRMPSSVEKGVGGTWDEGPFGPIPECPSSARVFQIGVAMDTGYFKVNSNRRVTRHCTRFNTRPFL